MSRWRGGATGWSWPVAPAVGRSRWSGALAVRAVVPAVPDPVPGGGSATAVTGTKDPGLFVGEHWGMRAFSCKIPNGKYLAKLYFAETYAGITGPGQRVFSFTVQGHEFKDFDIWAKAGGPRRAYIETVPVEVTNGEFRIVFTAQVENPAINAIEIIPQAEAGRRCGVVRSDNTDQGRPVHAVYGFERPCLATGSGF